MVHGDLNLLWLQWDVIYNCIIDLGSVEEVADPNIRDFNVSEMFHDIWNHDLSDLLEYNILHHEVESRGVDKPFCTGDLH